METNFALSLCMYTQLEISVDDSAFLLITLYLILIASVYQKERGNNTIFKSFQCQQIKLQLSILLDKYKISNKALK